MSSREHRERLVREGFEAFNRGDAEAVLAVLDPAVESHVGPSLANTGTWHGHAGFLEMLGTWGRRSLPSATPWSRSASRTTIT